MGVAVLVVALLALAIHWLSVFLSVITAKAAVVGLLSLVSLDAIGVGGTLSDFCLVFNYNLLEKVVDGVVLPFLLAC